MSNKKNDLVIWKKFPSDVEARQSLCRTIREVNTIENQRQQLLFGGIHIVLSDGSKPSGRATEMDDTSNYGEMWEFPDYPNYSSNCQKWQLLEVTVQQTQHLYDQENRITRQSWTIQGKTYSESYISSLVGSIAMAGYSALYSRYKSRHNYWR